LLSLRVALALLLAATLVPCARAQATGPWFLGVPYGTTAPGHPHYGETQLDVFYPPGGCPRLWGCVTPAMPVVVMARGGNKNTPLAGPEELSDLQLLMLAHGFVVVVPSYHELNYEAGESYLEATDDLGRAIQFLRYVHAIANIDPARVFLHGRSSGGFHALYLGLNLDFQAPHSPDPVARESSRPDFLIPWGASTDFSCVDYTNPFINDFISKLIFGVPDASGISKGEKLAASPVWWVTHPELYGCTTTPPMCLVYNLNWIAPCGAIVNVHDGSFGMLMQASIERLCKSAGAEQAACEDSILVDAFHDDTAGPAIVAWMSAMAY
jgi:hypothetical protein